MMQPSCARSRFGVTLVEIILAVLMLSLLFGSANGVMTYSRRETEKGFWIQQAITQLRNSTRAIAMKMKQTSYPSTLIRSSSGEEKVMSFKERREYDSSGRLRKLDINPSDAYELHSVISGSGAVLPSFVEQTIMYFPICEPERDYETGYTPGTITWIHIVLRPATDYRTSGLGAIHMDEHQETYDTRSTPVTRAFALNRTFDKSIPIIRSKELVTHVREVLIDYDEIKSMKGVYVTKAGALSDPIFAKRTMISMSISCCHPKDKKIWMSDQCSVINNVEMIKLPSPPMIELVKIFSTGAGGSAQVKLNGSDKTVNKGDMLNDFKVENFLDDALVLIDPATGIETYLTKLEE
jgi:hypothetical protein